MDMRLKDKVIIVTGGAQGLGRAYAVALSQEGATVVIADVLDAKQVEEEIQAKNGEALAIYTDVSDERSTKEMAHKAAERFGRIDVLINNAALYASLKTKPFFEISSEEWDVVMRVNLKGVFLCCKAVYPQMMKQGNGKIINVSSATHFKGLSSFVHYVTSKGGIISFTRALARELGDYGISVNAIAPGYTLTKDTKSEHIFDDAVINAAVASRCFKRHELPEDLTGTILFLASNDSDFMTGQTIVVDGGSVMH
jgi:NAD(P)-dependent dehydrogenase (short-subunit alcohol dehydrogenase family)